MKYIYAEQIRAEIERQKAYSEQTIKGFPHDLGLYYVGWMDLASKLLVFLDTHPEQPVEGLEKEIDACWQNWLSPSNQKDVEGVLPKTEFATYARHFAEWQKAKMLEGAVEGVAEELYNDGEIHCTVGVSTCFQPGQEVYVIKKEGEK